MHWKSGYLIVSILVTLSLLQHVSASVVLRYTGAPFDVAACRVVVGNGGSVHQQCLGGIVTGQILLKNLPNGVLSGATLNGLLEKFEFSAAGFGAHSGSEFCDYPGLNSPTISIVNGQVAGWSISAQSNSSTCLGSAKQPGIGTFSSAAYYGNYDTANYQGPGSPPVPDTVGWSTKAGSWSVIPDGAPSVQIIDPFAVKGWESGSINIGSLLQSSVDLFGLQATAIALDGASAGIVVVSTGNNSEAIQVAVEQGESGYPYGLTLTSYDPNFLNERPNYGGSATVVVKTTSFLSAGGKYYAVLLLQVPAGVGSTLDSPVGSEQVKIVAKQGKLTDSAMISVIRPDIIGLHGLWGDNSSLSSFASFYSKTYPGTVVSLPCYSKYLPFDALKDPLPASSPCEKTSADAITIAVDDLLQLYDSQRFIGGRVDLVAHSMGGLAARHYASMPTYRGVRDRGLGQFHTIVTIDTPESGSPLATFLINSAQKNASLEANIIPKTVYKLTCKYLTVSVGKCFDSFDSPLAAPGSAYVSGAVFSLEPSYISNLPISSLIGANIPGALWRAVSSDTSSTSNSQALSEFLNLIIAAVYPRAGPPTVNSIISHANPGDAPVPNDGIVSVASQTFGSAPDASYTFQHLQLSHTSGLPSEPIIKKMSSLLKFVLADDNVLGDPTNTVNRLVSCWLTSAGLPGGDTKCLQQAEQSDSSILQAEVTKPDAERPNELKTLLHAPGWRVSPH